MAALLTPLFVLLGLCFLFHLSNSTTSSTATTECVVKGFNPETLKCDTCDVMERVIGAAASGSTSTEGSSAADAVNVIEECQLCCNSDLSSGDNVAKHAKAVLEVDKRYLFSFPTIKEIIKAKSDSSNTKGKKSSSKIAEVASKFEVRYRLGQRPSLLLFSDSSSETPDDTLSIYTWDVETFVDYLKNHII